MKKEKINFSISKIRALAIISKSFANETRIKILIYINNHPNKNVRDISKISKIGYMTTARHIQILEKSGLINKKYDGLNIRHKITDRGEKVLSFLKKLL